MSDDKAMRKRFEQFCADRGWSCGSKSEFADVVVAWHQAELSRALQPREPAPELAEAETWLRQVNTRCDDDGVANAALVILGELDRLRAEILAISSGRGDCLNCGGYGGTGNPCSACGGSGKIEDQVKRLQQDEVELKDEIAHLERLAKENVELRETAEKMHAQPCAECDGQGYHIVDTSTDSEMSQDTRKCDECDGTGEAQPLSSQPAEAATRTWYQCATTAEEAIDPEEGYGFHTAEDAESHLVEDEHVYRLALTATKEPTT